MILHKYFVQNGSQNDMIYRNAERVTSKMSRIDVKKKALHIEKASAKDNGIYRYELFYY